MRKNFRHLCFSGPKPWWGSGRDNAKKKGIRFNQIEESNVLSPLTECKIGDRVEISEINAGRGASLNLANLGLHIGNIICLERRSPFKGPLTVEHQGSEIAIGFGLAQKILVTKV